MALFTLVYKEMTITMSATIRLEYRQILTTAIDYLREIETLFYTAGIDLDEMYSFILYDTSNYRISSFVKSALKMYQINAYKRYVRDVALPIYPGIIDIYFYGDVDSWVSGQDGHIYELAMLEKQHD